MAGELILIVEDNEKNMKLLRDVLVHRGYRILEATTGEDGVALAIEHTPDVVLMDIQLPGIDGIEAFRQLQSNRSTREIAVIAVTASAMQEQRKQIESEGFAGYQPKPIRIKEFLAFLEGILDAQGGGAAHE